MISEPTMPFSSLSWRNERIVAALFVVFILFHYEVIISYVNPNQSERVASTYHKKEADGHFGGRVEKDVLPVLRSFVSPHDSHNSVTVCSPDMVCELPDTKQAHIVHSVNCGSDSLGNGLSKIFFTALLAFQRNSTYELRCRIGDAILLKKKIWSMPVDKNMPNLCLGTNFWHTNPIGLNYAYPMIQEALRLYKPPADLDDLSVHLRCGDILKHKEHIEYGFPKYAVYKEFLGKLDLQTIGIVTTPFESEKARQKDAPFLHICREIATDLAKFFQELHPRAAVQIRNSDTAVEAIGRLVHSKYVWCNPSTFCLFPSIASAGSSFLVWSPKLYPFVQEIQAPNFHIVDRTFLNMEQVALNRMSAADIIAWIQRP